ncbi:tRNA uridine(34) 5-carboxymethylaminomethyl modification radical SAM/GNAT enzyme Elp3 [Candidatus Micrarchaeota archaeon]|nr:tRNA uridine(34) 5-carboxymethylaminomethyl modification radical SAM/GNAT enzyme Elp3 [Candidatus Micrarchaeota archaeon]
MIFNNKSGMDRGEFIKVVEDTKMKIAKKYKVEVPRNSEILKHVKNPELRKYLVKVPSRTISGVTPVALMTTSGCPHGRCIYCPRGKYAAQSYTGEEPASLRARQNMFDPFMQIKARLRQYRQLGHPTDKIEVIIMGGTFLAMSTKYKENFIMKIYEALNGRVADSIEHAKMINETAKHRVVGLTIETRPDWAMEKHINEMLTYGATRVEVGVQTLSDEVYEKVERGHKIVDVIKSTQLLKDSAFKIVYHMMPGLFATPEQDVQYFKTLFSDERFQPDMLKIYPTLVLKGTKLYDMWKKGEYKPYDSEQAAEVIAESMRYIPEYVRVMRIQRDIPSPIIAAGVKHSNLRQLVEQRMKVKGIKPREIRSREVGVTLNRYGKKLKLGNVQPVIRKYNASNGKEYFISYEDIDDDVILGFIRLRIPFKPFRPEIDNTTGLIRELHVYGSEVGIGDIPNYEQAQHKGLGQKLLSRAEDIAKDEGMKHVVVISGPGVRQYYYKHGYKLEGVYVKKRLV